MEEQEMNEETIQNIIANMKMYPVLSSNLVALGYDEVSRILRVIFKGNSSYIYFNVEPEVWNNLINAESKGKTLNETIVRQKDKYKYRKLQEAKEDENKGDESNA